MLTNVSEFRNSGGGLSCVPTKYSKHTRERITWHFHTKINQSFCGAGDVFASSLTGALLRGTSLEEAISISGDFVLESIKKTMEEEDYSTLYIDFEKALPWLMKRIGLLS